MANRPVNLKSLFRGGLLLALLVFPSLAFADVSIGYGNSLGGAYQMFSTHNESYEPLQLRVGSSVSPETGGGLTYYGIAMAGGTYSFFPNVYYDTTHTETINVSVASVWHFSMFLNGQWNSSGKVSITNVATGEKIEMSTNNMVTSFTGVPAGWGGAATITTQNFSWNASLEANIRLPAGNYTFHAETGMPSATAAPVTATIAMTYDAELVDDPFPITVAGGSASKEYDGAPLAIPPPTLTFSRLMFAHQLEVTGATTLVGPAAGNHTTTPGTVRVIQNHRGTIIDRTPHYAISLVNGSGSITARPITVTLGGSKEYDGTTTASGASASITSGSLAPGDVISYSFANTSSDASGAYTGLVAATVSNPASASNRTTSYAITYAGSYTITGKPQDPVTTANVSATYGDSATVAGSGGSGTGAWTFESVPGGTATGGAVSSAGTVTARSIGTVLFRVRKEGDAAYLQSNWASGTVTFTARPITVTLGGSKSYDGTTSPTGATDSITSGTLATGDSITYVHANTSSVRSGSYPRLTTATISNGTAPTDRTLDYDITDAGSYTITPVAPVMTSLAVADTQSRCAASERLRGPWTALPTPWALLARSGVRLSLGGQSAEDGVRDFEIQVLEPGLDAGQEQNWTTLTSVEASAPASTVQPVAKQSALASVQIGRTRANEQLPADGADLIPSPHFLALYEGLQVPASRLWTIRARCRAKDSGLWSSWRTYQINVVLPLVAQTVSLKAVPHSGTQQWFDASAQVDDVVYVWLP